MNLDQWLLINAIILLLSWGAFKTRKFGVAVLFTAMALLFIFKFGYDDVYYNHLVVANITEYVDASNHTIKEYTYTYYSPFLLGKNDLIYAYVALIGALIINFGIKFDRLVNRRRRKA